MLQPTFGFAKTRKIDPMPTTANPAAGIAYSVAIDRAARAHYSVFLAVLGLRGASIAGKGFNFGDLVVLGNGKTNC